MVLMMRLSMVYVGSKTNSDHLSIARGHCLTMVLGLPITTVKCSLAALNTKQQKDVVIFNGKITMGFVPCLLQIL